MAIEKGSVNIIDVISKIEFTDKEVDKYNDIIIDELETYPEFRNEYFDLCEKNLLTSMEQKLELIKCLVDKLPEMLRDDNNLPDSIKAGIIIRMLKREQLL